MNLVRQIRLSIGFRLVERLASFIKGFVLTGSPLALALVDSYALILALASLSFSAIGNTIEHFVVHENRCEFRYIFYRLSIGAPIFIILYWSIFSVATVFEGLLLLYYVCSTIILQTMYIVYRMNDRFNQQVITDIIHSLIFIVVALSNSAVSIQDLLIYFNIINTVALIYMIVNDGSLLKYIKNIEKNLTTNISARSYVSVFSVNIGIALSFAIDRFLYDAMTVGLVAISGLAYSLCILPLQITNIEKLYFFFGAKSRNERLSSKDIFLATLIFACIYSLMILAFSSSVGIFLLTYFTYPIERAEILLTIFSAYGIGIPVIYLHSLFDQANLINKKVVPVIMRLILVTLLNIFMSIIFVHYFQLYTIGIALGTVLSYVFSCLLLRKYFRAVLQFSK